MDDFTGRNQRLEGVGATVRVLTRKCASVKKTMPNQADRNDARALAHIMRTGGLAGLCEEPPKSSVNPATRIRAIVFGIG
ncbi:MAG: hypothetical protein KGL26_13040, partial [Pseudomonadota bacterium]|nr:hypothetical protein [Pseudomonadota bacterium]